MPKDYYDILGISRDASNDDIKHAFHKLAHKHHPHKGGDEKKFKEINEAYQILSDKEKRAQYDQFGRVFSAQGGPASGGDGGPGNWDFNWQWGQPGGQQGQEGFENNFDFGDLSDVFGDIFGFGQQKQKDFKSKKRGKDLRIDIELDLEDTLLGIEKEINVRKLVTCSRCYGSGGEPGTEVEECFSCRGTGEVQQVRRTVFGSFTQVTVCPECGGEGHKPKKPCNVCKGEGRIKGEEKISVFIPSGVDNNQVIKVSGKGEAGKKSGKAGDLYLRIFVKPHPVFERKGDDIFLAQEINFSQVALGDDIEIPTLEKKSLILKIAAGTESGKILRITGKGIPHFQGYGKGNMYVEIVVRTPKHISRRQKELLEDLKKEGL